MSHEYGECLSVERISGQNLIKEKSGKFGIGRKAKPGGAAAGVGPEVGTRQVGDLN